MCAVFVRNAVRDCLEASPISDKASRLELWMIRVCTNHSTKFGLPTRNHGARWTPNCRSSRNTRRGNERYIRKESGRLNRLERYRARAACELLVSRAVAATGLTDGSRKRCNQANLRLA